LGSVAELFLGGIFMHSKMKRLALVAAVLAFCSALASLGGLFIFTDLSATDFGIGIAIAFVVILIGYFIVLSMASAAANETGNAASQLAKTASAMAAGNFNINLQTGVSDEIGQVESALSQLSQIQKNLSKDIEAFAKRHAQGDMANLIDENNYNGDYRELVKRINNTVSSYTDLISAISEAINALAIGDLKSHSLPPRSEVGNALEDLRRKFETMNRELQNSLSAAEAAKKETEVARDEIASARKDAAFAREDASSARRDADTARREADTAKRDADTARRDAQRATGQFKPAAPTASATRPAVTPRSAITPRPAVTTRTETPKPPPTAPASSARKLNSNDAAPSLKAKIIAPSGAHEYDRKDYGKY